MHPIRRYCEEHDITQREFAEQVGLSDPFISQLISGRDKCGRNAALQMVAETDGEISLEELQTWNTDGIRAAS